jgi:hypothetical protein
MANNKMNIGKTTFIRHQEEQVMKELSNAFTDDNYYAFEVSSNFVNKMKQTLIDRMTRPR